MKVLVTGGAGFIGSHCCVQLIDEGYDVTVIDNFSNSNIQAINNIELITGKKISFFEIDLLDEESMNKLFLSNKFDAVMHFAGSKSVSESVELPFKYYFNNVYSSILLGRIMAKYDVKNLIFSSSATVYGEPSTVPISESFPISSMNPYATSKIQVEKYLRKISADSPDWRIVVLRYFNPIGAHESGLLGDNPNDKPNNLMPFILKVAAKEEEYLEVFGNDYETEDGTGVRDYIHVSDLSDAHVSSLNYLFSSQDDSGFYHTINIGTGTGYSVLEIIETFKRINNIDIPYKIVSRRPGDVSQSFTDTQLSREILQWRAKKDLNDMCRDSWDWKRAEIKRMKNNES
jgi:UDP-glucose 4-epimerase